MILKKIATVMTAMALMSCCTLPVFADDTQTNDVKLVAKDSDEAKAPTLSFDMSDWSNFIHNSKDASVLSLSTSQEKTYAYQGATLRITGSLAADYDKYVMFQGIENKVEKDGKETTETVYPETNEDGSDIVRTGIVLQASDFGLESFNNCLITFKYRINQEMQGKLYEDTIFVCAADDDENSVQSALNLKIDTTLSNNVTQFAKGFYSVGDVTENDEGVKQPATKILINIPVTKKLDKTDILYIDNLNIENDTDKVANVDGYNSGAKAQEIVEGLTINAKKSDTNVKTSSAEKKTGSSNVMLYVGGGVLLVIVAGVAVFVIKKHKNRFY